MQSEITEFKKKEHSMPQARENYLKEEDTPYSSIPEDTPSSFPEDTPYTLFPDPSPKNREDTYYEVVVQIHKPVKAYSVTALRGDTRQKCRFTLCGRKNSTCYKCANCQKPVCSKCFYSFCDGGKISEFLRLN